VVIQNNRFLAGYAWFVTEDVKRGLRRPGGGGSVDALADYPVGLVAVTASRRQLRPITFMRNTIRLIGRALRRYQRKTASTLGATSTDRRRVSSSAAVGSFNSDSSCLTDARRPYFANGDLLYR